MNSNLLSLRRWAFVCNDGRPMSIRNVRTENPSQNPFVFVVASVPSTEFNSYWADDEKRRFACIRICQYHFAGRATSEQEKLIILIKKEAHHMDAWKRLDESRNCRGEKKDRWENCTMLFRQTRYFYVLIARLFSARQNYLATKWTRYWQLRREFIFKLSPPFFRREKRNRPFTRLVGIFH